MSSGVLCKFTGYVGISKDKKVELSSEEESSDCANELACCYKPAKNMACRPRAKPKKRGRCKKPKKRPRCSNSDDSDSDKIETKEEMKLDDKSSDNEKGVDSDFNSNEIENTKAMKLDDECCDEEIDDELCNKEKSGDSDRPKKCKLKLMKRGKSMKKRKSMNKKRPMKRKMKQDDDSVEEEEEYENEATKISKSQSNKKEMLKRKPYDLMSLLRLQDFHGYWDDLDEINAMLGSNISSINGVDVSPSELTLKCVATILAIAALHVKSNDQKNLWTMIEQKAVKWLKKSLPEANIDQLIKDTESLIN